MVQEARLQFHHLIAVLSSALNQGIAEVWELLVSGRLKVMTHLNPWLREFRRYHRDDKDAGKIVKRDDHLMDATRYLVVSGPDLMRLPPKPRVFRGGPPRRGPMNWAS